MSRRLVIQTTTLMLTGLGAAAALADVAPAAVHFEPLRFEPIVVTATRHAMALAAAPASMSVVDAQAIRARGADNLLQALRGEPGVSLFGRTISGRKSVMLRGMDPRHTLVLVDGRRISASDGVVGHSDFQLDWAAPIDVERIEVLRGPMSVLYGAEAMGGVVNVITPPLPLSHEGAAYLEGSHATGGRGGDGHRAAVSLRGPLVKAPEGERQVWRYGVSASVSRRDAVSGNDPRVAVLEGRYKRDADLRLQARPIAGHAFDIEARVGTEDRWADSRERSGARRYHESWHDLERRHLSLGWQGDWGGEQRVETQLRAYTSRLEVTNVKTNGVASLRPNTLQDDVVDGQAALSVTAAQRLTSGFELREEALQNAGLPGGSNAVTHQALFVQDEAELSEALTLTGGLRWDRHEIFGPELSPRLYAVWRAAPQWVIKGGIGHGYKVPTLKQITAGYQEDEGPNTFHGNPALKPESNDSIEAGVTWDTPGLGVSALLFHNRVRDLMVARQFGVVSGRAQYVYENIDRARLQGLEMGVSWRSGPWAVQAQYTYLDAVDGNDARLEKRPRQQMTLRGEWNAQPWRAGLTIERQEDMLLASLNSGQPLQRAPDLTFVSLHGAYAVRKGVELRAGVDNVADVNLSRKSPLFTYAEQPRTWRLALHAQW